MCQSLAKPSVEAYWHIGERTMRLSRVSPRSLIGVNSLASDIGVSSLLFGDAQLRNRLVPTGDLLRGVFRELVRIFVRHGHTGVVDAVPKVGALADLLDLGRQPLDDVAGRAGRRIDAVPGIDLEPGNAG